MNKRLLESNANVDPDSGAWHIVDNKKEFLACNSAARYYWKARSLLESFDTPWTKWFLDSLKDITEEYAEKARNLILHINDNIDISQIGMQTAVDIAPQVLVLHRTLLLKCTSVDDMIFICNKVFIKEKCSSTDFAIYILNKLKDLQKQSDKPALKFFEYAVPAESRIPPPGSAGRILFDNTEQIYRCKSIEEIVAICHELFDAADLMTSWTNLFFKVLDGMMDRDASMETAFSYIANVINRACHLTDKRKFHECDGSDSSRYSRKEIEETIEYWKNKLLESEDDQDIESDDIVNDMPNDPFTDLCLEISLAMKHNGCYSRRCLDDVCEIVRDFLIDEYDAKPYDLPDVKSMDISM